MTIHPVDYIIDLSTGEEIHIAEFDPARIPELNQSVILASADVLDRCTKVSRDILEEAKSGYDTRLKPLLKISPVGALVKIPLPLCHERKECSMYEPSKCTTRNIGFNIGKFPICWEACDSSTDISDDIIVSRALRTAIVHSWRQGWYSVLVVE